MKYKGPPADTIALHGRRAMLRGIAIAGVLAAARTFPFAEAAERDPALRVLEAVCDLVIPATDTPGALAAGVPAFVVIALQHGLEGTGEASAYGTLPGTGRPFVDSSGRFNHLEWLAAELSRRGGGGFLAGDPSTRVRALSELDMRAFDRAAPDADAAPWVALKKLIVIGYYTSEVGGSVELRYEHQPSRWDADLPLTPGDRALSNDWTAVEFG